MNFVFMHQTVVSADAIGHDILLMYRSLESRGHQCYVCCEHLGQMYSWRRLEIQDAGPLLDDPRTAVIYHHSIYWALGEKLLAGAAGRIIFRYHNITPPNYFAAEPANVTKCAAGREQTYRFTYRFPGALWLTASFFNLREIGIDEVVSYRVVPPFLNLFEDGETLPDDGILKRLMRESGAAQALFVGRFAPNKGHLLLIRVLAEYRRRHGGGLRLFVIGKLDDSSSAYYQAVMAAVESEGLQEMFCLLGETSPAQLLAYFLGCDAYLCCSEHEGFCVPVVEAQALCLPVIARACTAVPETIGEGQILRGDDPGAYADSLRQLTSDPDYRDNIIEKGRQNYLERFTHARIEHSFLSSLHEYLGEEL